jgi:hypothetical protein
MKKKEKKNSLIFKNNNKQTYWIPPKSWVQKEGPKWRSYNWNLAYKITGVV